MKVVLTAGVVSVLLAAAACGDEDEVTHVDCNDPNIVCTTTNNTTNNSTNNQTASNNASNNTTTPTNNDTTTNNATTTNGGVVESCEQIDASVCEYSMDCTETTVCETQNNPETEVRCCVPGTRGTKQLGEECSDTVEECESGACVNNVCAERCTTEGECPTGYACNAVLFLCLPE